MTSVLTLPPRIIATALAVVMAFVAGTAAAQGAPDSVAAVADSVAPAPRPVETGPWGPDRHWLDFRVGYAKSLEQGAADGNIGAGFGFTYMGKSRWSLGAHTHVELLGRFGGAAEIEVPMTFEVARHFGWKSVARPYLGAGGGAFFHKTYRTGADEAHVRPGFMLVGGFNAAVSDANLLGIDVRMVFQGSASSRNPVFPNDTEDAVHWSVKLNYAIVQ